MCLKMFNITNKKDSSTSNLPLKVVIKKIKQTLKLYAIFFTFQTLFCNFFCDGLENSITRKKFSMVCLSYIRTIFTFSQIRISPRLSVGNKKRWVYPTFTFALRLFRIRTPHTSAYHRILESSFYRDHTVGARR